MEQITLNKQHLTEQSKMLHKSSRQRGYVQRTENCYGVRIFPSCESNCLLRSTEGSQSAAAAVGAAQLREEHGPSPCSLSLPHLSVSEYLVTLNTNITVTNV